MMEMKTVMAKLEIRKEPPGLATERRHHTSAQTLQQKNLFILESVTSHTL